MDARRGLIVALVALFAGCDAEPIAAVDGGATEDASAGDPCATETPPSWCTVTLPDRGKGCAFDVPDGVCTPVGPNADTCDCSDCQGTALCTSSCVDDGHCDLVPGSEVEDCSCSDCFRKVQDCSPPPVGCNTDGVCGSDDDCTCPDCDGDPRCASCIDNLDCVPFLEGCGCSDCAGRPTCARDAGVDASAD